MSVGAKKLKKNEVTKLMAEWVDRLGLWDWRIDFAYSCEPDEVPLTDACGCTSWQESTKTAMIRILDESYYGDRVIPFDFEEILVHELLHLKLCILDYEDGDDMMNTHSRVLHQVVDDLARALISAKRKGAKKNEGSKENTQVLQRTGKSVDEGAGLEVRSADEQRSRCVCR